MKDKSPVVYCIDRIYYDECGTVAVYDNRDAAKNHLAALEKYDSDDRYELRELTVHSQPAYTTGLIIYIEWNVEHNFVFRAEPFCATEDELANSCNHDYNIDTCASFRDNGIWMRRIVEGIPGQLDPAAIEDYYKGLSLQLLNHYRDLKAYGVSAVDISKALHQRAIELGDKYLQIQRPTNIFSD